MPLNEGAAHDWIEQHGRLGLFYWGNFDFPWVLTLLSYRILYYPCYAVVVHTLFGPWGFRLAWVVWARASHRHTHTHQESSTDRSIYFKIFICLEEAGKTKKKKGTVWMLENSWRKICHLFLLTDGRRAGDTTTCITTHDEGAAWRRKVIYMARHIFPPHTDYSRVVVEYQGARVQI